MYGLTTKPALKAGAIAPVSAKLYRGIFDVLASSVAAAEADTGGLQASAVTGPALRRGYGALFELCISLLSPDHPLYRVVGISAATFLEKQLLSRPGAIASGELRNSFTQQCSFPPLGVVL